MPPTITRHARDRIRRRVGIPKRAVKGWAERAIKSCEPPKSNSSLDRWARGKTLGRNGYSRIYGGFLLIFRGDVLATVYTIPGHLVERARCS